MSVERVTHLHAQRVARAETGRDDAGLPQRLEHAADRRPLRRSARRRPRRCSRCAKRSTPTPATVVRSDAEPLHLPLPRRHRGRRRSRGPSVPGRRSSPSRPSRRRSSRRCPDAAPSRCSRSSSRRDAFITTTNSSSPIQNTIRSSIVPPSGVHHRVYCALPGAMRVRSFVPRRLQDVERVRPAHADAGHVRDVEHPGGARERRGPPSRIEPYRTGSRQPAKVTNRPPASSWAVWSGDLERRPRSRAPSFHTPTTSIGGPVLAEVGLPDLLVAAQRLSAESASTIEPVSIT